MPDLTKQCIEKAWSYLAQNPRQLDNALARHVVLEQPAEAVWAELEAYQNTDGGFAQGIEPDLRTPLTQGISTSVAFQYLRSSGAPSSLPMVQRAIAHLLETLDRKAWVWPAIDDGLDAAPHAPWWDATDLDRYIGFVFNPSTELAGYLFDHAALVPPEIRDGLAARILHSLKVDHPGPLEIYDLYPCIRLFHSPNLPAELRELLTRRLPGEISAISADNAHAMPFQVVPTPTSPGASAFSDRLAAMPSTLAATQDDSGAWRPFWNWDFVDATEWKQADQAWSAVLTANALIGLHHHRMLPG
ncbi:hypothetical protein CLV78_103384 [Aliiruegeria haliotis]|uniref:Prenyltransferase/squalene oxidase-like repeat protein n=1 Tax=Aliiruegeria haliotis TaxID=1280846 RepID=A0A2T0RTQ3_9RHOB|nr:hypothetical protein [Aliiruegeria haliotis]PRY24517.1 hypothetical protein CLV78_103384 [Aliiruegeria haliotis]